MRGKIGSLRSERLRFIVRSCRLPGSDGALLVRVSDVMNGLGRSVGDSVCLVERVAG